MKRSAKTISAIMCFAFVNAPAFAEEKNAPPPPMPAHEGMGGMSEDQMDTQMRQMQKKNA